MIKKLSFVLVFLALFSALHADNIGGFWKVVNDKTGKVDCVIAVYEYQERFFGRIIGTFDKSGYMAETIYNPKTRAPGLEGNPYYCGLDIIWNLKSKGRKYKGKIVDPKRGKVYRAELWTEEENLIVRGELLIFGRNQIWLPALDSDFPPDFKKPDVTKFVPVVPVIN